MQSISMRVLDLAYMFICLLCLVIFYMFEAQSHLFDINTEILYFEDQAGRFVRELNQNGSFNDTLIHQDGTIIELSNMSIADHVSHKHFILDMISRLPDSRSILKEHSLDILQGAERKGYNWIKEIDDHQNLFSEAELEKYRTIIAAYEQRLPDAMIIGCKKCGTTALHLFLKYHSQIAFKAGEGHFFDEKRGDLDEYRSMMPASFADQITMECTPRYWVTPSAPLEIMMMNPKVKLLLIVRDPVKRAISDFDHVQRLMKNHHATGHSKYPGMNVHDTFEEHIVDIFGEVNTSREVLTPSFYDVHMKHWLQVLPLSQMHILSSEDLRSNWESALRSIEEFLGLDHELVDKITVRRKYWCVLEHAMFGRKCLTMLVHDHPPVSGHVIRMLEEELEPQARDFYRLAGRDYGWF